MEELISNWHNTLSDHQLEHEFVIVEDGSTDGTKELIIQLEKKFPIINLSQNDKRGYMRRNKFTKRRKSKAIKVSGLTVKILEPSAVEAGISAFKKAVKESQILYTLKKREYYRKPSAVRREKKNLVKLRQKYSIEN